MNDLLVKKLDICFPPPLYYSLHVAISLSIILSKGRNEDWFYNNFIQVSFCSDDEILKGGHMYCIYPSMETRPGQFAASKYLIEKHLDLNVIDIPETALCNKIKLFIDNGYYISCIVDVSKLRGTRYEKFDFARHRIMIFGYDFKLRTFDILDFDHKEVINKVKILMDDFVSAYTSQKLLMLFNSKVNNTIILYERRNSTFKVDLELVKEALYDYLNSYNSSIRYSLILPRNDDCSWGIATYGDIFEYMHKVRDLQEQMDVRLFQAFYEHKKIMFERFKYFDMQNIYHIKHELLHDLEINMKTAKLSKMLVLKYNITNDVKIIYQVIQKLNEIEVKEKYVYEAILELI